jgi:hypothetical protein
VRLSASIDGSSLGPGELLLPLSDLRDDDSQPKGLSQEKSAVEDLCVRLLEDQSQKPNGVSSHARADVPTNESKPAKMKSEGRSML